MGGSSTKKEKSTFFVTIERKGGAVTVYKQRTQDMIEALTLSEREHKDVWGYKGTVIYAARD